MAADAGALAGGGAPTGADALLAQIRSLLEQYLAMGTDTPVAPEAQQLADSIDAAMGSAPAGPDAMAEGTPPSEDNTQMLPGESGYSGTSMDDATKGATDFLKKRNRIKAA